MSIQPVHNEVPLAGLESLVGGSQSVKDHYFLNERLTSNVSAQEAKEQWRVCQEAIGGLLLRMGRERGISEAITQLPFVPTVDGVSLRVAMLPMMGRSAFHSLTSHGVSDLHLRISGMFGLMELSAAAGYRTFCFPKLVEGLSYSNKMRDKPIRRMIDTFTFLATMIDFPLDHQVTRDQFKRTNDAHRMFGVAGAEVRELFEYILLNMFLVGPRTRPDLLPEERHALCGIAVHCAKRLGHNFEGSVNEFEAFIDSYEQKHMMSPDSHDPVRAMAISIAQASENALRKIPGISKDRIHRDVPWRVKRILEIS